MEEIQYKGETGDIRATLALPEGTAKAGGIVVIAEIWGLNDHIKDVAKRFAAEGFIAIAPDPFSPLGGSPDDPQKAFPLIRELDREATIKNYIAAQQYLQNHPRCNGNVGVTGFCWGGGMTNQVAVHSPDLKAAVPYYGGQPEAADVPRIKASMMLHYAGNDERINAGIPAYEEALKKAGVEYTLYMYDGANHGFNNDTREVYHKAAAELAWQRTVAFFKEKLKS